MKRCSDCYFGDKCHSCCVCDNYYPINPERAEEDLFDVIEQERLSYLEAWLEYVEDDFYF